MKHCNCSTQKGDTIIPYDNSRLEILIRHGKMSLEYEAYSSDSSFISDIEIKFCPKCGRDVTGDRPSEVDEMTLSEIYTICENHKVAGYSNLNLTLLTLTVEGLLAKEREENEIV